MTFDQLNLNNPLLKALADLEYIHPTPVQVQSLPAIMSGRDVVGIAQTGTGKTMAYLLPILRQLNFTDSKHPRVIVLVPTRELVLQVADELEKLTTYMTVRVGRIYGGGNINTQKQMVFQGLDILVATPGRLVDLAVNGSVKLKNVQKLVIDEVDEMLEQEFRKQLTTILDYLPAKRQNILFSATLTEEVSKLIQGFFNDPVKIEVAAHGTPLGKIVQLAYEMPNFGTKVNLLKHLLDTDETMSKVLVFVGKIKIADKLFEQVHTFYPKQVGILHSRKSQNQRIDGLKQFETNKYRILIATDVAARGLDISDVTHVVNFDTPTSPNDYLHRIGRTGRVGKDGIAITFMNEEEEEYLKAAEEVMHKQVAILPWPEPVEYSNVFSEAERPISKGKNYLKGLKRYEGGPSFHDKKDKNKKVNLGGSYKKTGGKKQSVNRNVLRNRSKRK
ncbi:DEAD/DEAH box helicase [Bacteroidetes bacterium UKL13-3]|jgi:ATP-dependent RNA helicase RhlE|nr:DEAD/DEAH box helicase [Bacteroidetes bacterium UKL13-3]HCP92603.1 DEAD/DEAH box helicase [Bacteroidota bacterium]